MPNTVQLRFMINLNRHFLKSLLIGLFIALFLIMLHHKHIYLVQELEDTAIDWMIALYQGHLPTPTTPSTPYIFLDIDERTYQAWGEPLYMPRNHLLTLIQFAVNNQAQVVIVDIDLSQSRLPESDDKELQTYLENYSTRCSPLSTSSPPPLCPPIILVRSLRPLLDELGQPTPQLEARPSFLEATVEKSNHVFWATAEFYLEKYYYIRHWQLWHQNLQKPNFLPSIQLLAAKLLKNPDQPPLDLLACLQDQYRPSSSDTASTATPPSCENQSDLNLSPTQTRLQQRIVYKMPWHLENRPLICPASACPPAQFKSLLEIISAHSIIQATTHQQPPEEGRIKDSVVLIGGSFADSRDLYATPVGIMPGALIILNSIHSLLQPGELNVVGWLNLLVEAILIVVISLFFIVFGTSLGKMFIYLMVTFGLLFILSLWQFSTGGWLDFAIPPLAVIFHYLYEKSPFAKHHSH